ncbi:MAG TPA: hypothetical protein VKT70_15105 [Stellaceae bacterium]|nr:hypothetical protein [Stellaceae bacterium]
MLRAIIREPFWLAHQVEDGHVFHLNWIANVEDEAGDIVDLDASLGESILMATHCVGQDDQGWVWGTWWGESTRPTLRRGRARSLRDAQAAAISAGLEMAEGALRVGHV